MRYFNIRLKLYILIVVLMMPLVIFQSITIASQYKHNIETELDNSEDFAVAISGAFTNYLEQLWDTELAIGTAIISNPSISNEQIEDYMVNMLCHQTIIMRYNWISPDGIVIASTKEGGEGVDLSDREHVKRIINGEEEVVSGIVQARLSNHVILPVARGVRKDGKLLGIIVAAVDVDKIGNVLPISRVGKTSVYGLMDNSGMLVFRSGSSDMPFEKRRVRQNCPAMSALQGRMMRMEKHVVCFDNTKCMGVFLPVHRIGWVSYCTIPADEVLDRHRVGVIRNIKVLLLVIVVSFAGVVFATDRYINSIEILQRAAQSIFKGDLTVRTNIDGNDELAEAAWAFDRMAERIEQLEINRRLFLQTSAHELRNPMTGIKGISSLIRKRVDAGRPPGDMVQMIGVLEKEVDRLAKILNDILEAFRAQQGDLQFKADYKPVNIMEVIKKSLKPFEFEESSHYYTLSGTNLEEIWIMGNSMRFEGVMNNILRNAVKYSPSGGKVQVSVEADDENVIISVKDEGIGIPEEHVDRIFESFYRSNNFNGNDPGGMGLGLYICKDVIQRHGGTIWAENNKDKGSTFYIRLPLYKGNKNIGIQEEN